MWAPLALLAFVGCGDEPASNPGHDTVEFISAGSGEANAEPLYPLRTGTVSAYKGGTVRPPVEFAPGRVGYRVWNRATTLPLNEGLDAASESWLSEDDVGVWFEGATRGGVLDVPILLVPAEVRVGMRWRTGSEAVALEYEVLQRDEVETDLGPTVVWTIVQVSATPIYRLYAEGWGLLALSERSAPDPATWTPAVPIRSVTGVDPEPEQSTGPALSLREVLTDEALSGRRIDSARAVRLGDGRTLINLLAMQRNATPGAAPYAMAFDLLYEAGALVPSIEEAHFPPEVVHTRVSPWHPDPPYGYARLGALGNVVHVADRVVWSLEDMPMWENERGGVSGTSPLGVIPEGDERFELPLAPPGFGENNTTRPHWGAFHPGTGRFLLPPDATPARVPFGRVERPTGELWIGSSEPYADGRLTTAPRFIEAFPDAMRGLPETDRQAGISTSTGVGAQVHLFTTPGGVVDRIEVDGEGARRVRLGRATLPADQELRAAVDPGDGRLVLFTFDRVSQSAHVFVAEGATPAPLAPAPFIAFTWTGWDARICWPTTSEPLDPSGWRLGPVPAAAVLPDGDRCAIVVRDLEALPIPRGATAQAPPVGWSVFEGDVPGAGHVRAFEPVTYPEAAAPPSGGAWLSDGTVISNNGGAPGSATLRYSASGIQLGRAPFVEFFGGVPDQSGAGLWAYTTLKTWPDGHCGLGCEPDFVFAIALSGPTPHTWELAGTWDPQFQPVQSGGVLIGTAPTVLAGRDHVGWAHLRTDGTVGEITLPASLRLPELLTMRATGEVCGRAREATMTSTFDLVWCARSDGTGVRTLRLPTGTSALAMHLLDDDTALVQGPRSLWLLGLDTMTSRPFPDAGTVSFADLRVGHDGLTYGVFTPEGGEATWGIFRVSGFTPISANFDVDGISVEARELTDLLVAERFAYLSFGTEVVRVPRARWDGASACTPTTAPDLDADGDGFVAATSCGRDCDDSSSAVHPDAAEVCDGVDNDCNGVVDEVGGTCWVDADGDGYAAVDAAPMTICGCPAGTTATEPTGADIDCADGDARAFPGQTMYFTTPVMGMSVPLRFDFDCDGTEEGRWPIATCTDAGAMMCTRTEGFAGFAPCGSLQPFQGCPDPTMPTMCGGSCGYDSLLRFCAQDTSTLLWTQECR